MKDNKIPVNQNWVVEGGFGEEDGYKGFMEMYKRGTLPAAILAVTYPVALGMYEAALDIGIRIPEDIIVTCFGNNNFKHLVPSMFNFVDQPTTELGKESVNLVLKIINSPKTLLSPHIELKTKLLLRGNGQRSESVA
jgi:LacI family transcriptional regulator